MSVRVRGRSSEREWGWEMRIFIEFRFHIE